MLGAIIGDIVGSRFEWHNRKSKDFELFTEQCRFTDDTAMTVAIAKALLECDGKFDYLSDRVVGGMQDIGRRYLNCGFGQSFWLWLHKENPKPYGSYGNGAAMRISPVSYVARSEGECIAIADAVTQVTHNHPEGMKGARAAALTVWDARNGATKQMIRKVVEDQYYILDFTIDEIRPKYRFDVSCQGSVPQAIKAFLESEGFEDTIRLAVSIGGDSDTIAAIAGGIAEAYYGIPYKLWERAMDYLPQEFLDILGDFQKRYG